MKINPFSPVLLVLCLMLFRCGSEKQPPPSTDSAAADTAHTHDFSSIHHEHSMQIASMGNLSEKQWDSINGIHHDSVFVSQTKLNKKFKVFGWHPTSMGTAYNSYEFDLLWGVGFFSAEVDPATGKLKNIYNWKTTPLVDLAKKSGTKVFLTVTNFGASANTQLLSNPASTQTLVDSLIYLVKLRKADGVSVDFESVPGSMAGNLTGFMQKLSTQLKKEVPGAQVLLALYTVDWSKTFQIQQLNPWVDLYTIMGYDYYYTGSPQAGPVSPQQSGSIWAPYNLEKSVDYYLGQGAPPEKVILALPYYGRQWYTEAATYPSKNTGYIQSPAYKNYIASVQAVQTLFDNPSKFSCLTGTHNGKTTQLWYMDAKTLSANYDYVISKNLAGIGIWALGYDNGRKELWQLIEDKFGQK